MPAQSMWGHMCTLVSLRLDGIDVPECMVYGVLGSLGEGDSSYSSGWNQQNKRSKSQAANTWMVSLGNCGIGRVSPGLALLFYSGWLTPLACPQTL